MHVHIGMQDLTNRPWIFGANISEYIDPATFMGLPSSQTAVGKTGIYYGYVPTPTTQEKRKNFNWAVFTRKIKNR